MGSRHPLSRARRVVVKVGSGLITTAGEGPSSEAIARLATDIAATRECLHNACFRELQKQEVVVVPVEDEPGAAAGVFQRIADAHINVRYTYMATGNRLVIAAGNPNAVLKALAH